MRNLLMPLVFVIVLLGTALDSKADVINFEAQGAGAPSSFTGTLNSPLVIGVATFTGGQLLNHEVNSVDQTAVYGTTNVFGGAYTDPLTINFSRPISGFSIDVTNELGDTYTVADNLGGSQGASLAINTTHTFSLSDTGVTSITINSANHGIWDFAIDNVVFTPVVSGVPEPSTILLLASVFGIVGILARHR
jgi:hypothetical protein